MDNHHIHIFLPVCLSFCLLLHSFLQHLNSVHIRFIFGSHSVYIRFTFGLYSVHNRFTVGLHSVYIRFTIGLYSVFLIQVHNGTAGFITGQCHPFITPNSWWLPLLWHKTTHSRVTVNYIITSFQVSLDYDLFNISIILSSMTAASHQCELETCVSIQRLYVRLWRHRRYIRSLLALPIHWRRCIVFLSPPGWKWVPSSL